LFFSKCSIMCVQHRAPTLADLYLKKTTLAEGPLF